MVRHSIKFKRRQFLKGTAALLCTTASHAQDAPAGLVLTAEKTKSQILGPESPPTEHWRFSLSTGEAVIRARQGEELKFIIANNTGEDLWLHFFGVRGPSEMMTVHVLPDSSSDVVFTPPDAGTFWLGPLLNASKQRELGLAMMLIVEEAGEQTFQDVPLMFDDWSIGEDGKIEQDFANLNRAAGEGRPGNWFTVNSVFKPRMTLDPEKPARLRLLNVANSRTMSVLLKGAEAIVLAVDGQPQAPQPLGLRPLVLAPGQRIDAVLTEAQPQVVVALDLQEDVVEAAFFDAPGYGRKTLPTNLSLPANPVSVWDQGKPVRDITIAIEGGLKGGLQRANVGHDVLDLRAMLEQGLVWSIGGSAGLGSPPLFEAMRGEQVKLVFDNRTGFQQLLYVHGHVWSAADPALLPTAWTASADIPAKAQKAVWMVADNSGTWAIQSLQAERCDAGLIGAFTVADMP
jgi:FtsP/CotA-like multicopper oxidase with cupredoxin domain